MAYLPAPTMYPSAGAQGPMQPDDPLTALATLLGVSPEDVKAKTGLPTTAPPTLSPNAQDAVTLAQSRSEGIDAGERGLEMEAKYPQTFVSGATPSSVARLKADEAADPFTGTEAQARVKQMQTLSDFFLPQAEQQRAEDVANKMAIARAPVEATMAGNLALQQMKGQAAEDVARIAHPFSEGGGGGGGNTVEYLATQALRDPTTLTKISDKDLRNAVMSQMASSGGDINTLTNQTRQMSETANDLLPLIDQVRQQAQMLHDKGLFDLAVSPVRGFLVKHGAGSLLGYGPEAAQEVGNFQTMLGLLQSGVARAHAGARGAGNIGMAQRFEQLMGAQGDLPTFLGQLNGVQTLLQKYGAHTAPSSGAQPDQTDPYANPDWGKE